MILKSLTLLFICFCGQPSTSISSVKSEDFKTKIESPIVTPLNTAVKSEDFKPIVKSLPIDQSISNSVLEKPLQNLPQPAPLSPLPLNVISSSLTNTATTASTDFQWEWESDSQKEVGEEICNDSSSVPHKKQCYTIVKYCISCHTWTTNLSELSKKKDDIIFRVNKIDKTAKYPTNVR